MSLSLVLSVPGARHRGILAFLVLGVTAVAISGFPGAHCSGARHSLTPPVSIRLAQ